MWCIVNLPNGTQQAVKLDPKAMGQECLEKVCKALGVICEMEYFGLEHWSPNQKETRTRQWINLRNRLSCDSAGSGIQLMLALRVKFWVPVHFILQQSVRNLFYMQAKVDLLEGRLNAHDWNNAAKLSALLCQADGIRFNEAALKCKCPLKMRKEQEEQQESCHHQHQSKSLKDKEHVLSFKKRRLSKQRSIDNIECHTSGTIASSSCNSTNTSGTVNSTTGNPGAACNAQDNKTKRTNEMQASTTPPTTSTITTAIATTSITSITSTPTTSSGSPLSNPNEWRRAPSISLLPPSVNTNASNSSPANDPESVNKLLMSSPLRIYQDYVVRPINQQNDLLPDDFLRQIAIEHSKLFSLKITQKSAKYWLLQEIQTLRGYGEEVFSGVTVNDSSVRCDIAVGSNGINITTGDNTNHISFSAIAAAKSFRRTFKLEYIDDHNDRREIEIKLSKHAIAAGLYRSITERHAFYVCDKVRGVVTNQFTRDLKGTIASMFKEDTELGKRYVFDIQRTSREVHDQARRILHDRGLQPVLQCDTGFEEFTHYLPRLLTTNEIMRNGASAIQSVSNQMLLNESMGCRGDLNEPSSISSKLDLVLREKQEREAVIERCVDNRISEAMTCKICMDRAINTMFNPCCHVMACDQCAARCENCPNCRVKISNVVKIYLPPELRIHPSTTTTGTPSSNVSLSNDNNVTQTEANKISMAA